MDSDQLPAAQNAEGSQSSEVDSGAMRLDSAPTDPVAAWFRQFTPYVHAHRGRTFVIAFGGEAVADPGFPGLVHDIALLHGLGIRLVLVHGARPQIEERLAMRGAEMRYVNGLRITDAPALASVKDAAGATRLEIEALLSLGLANSPMAGVQIPVASGNFVVARPLGVLDGVDYGHTGAVRRIDQKSLRARLDQGAVALIPPVGYSPTGEVFNLAAADVARSTAIALGADKLIFLVEGEGLQDAQGRPITHLLPGDIEDLLAAQGTPPMSEDLSAALRAGLDACRSGIPRVHLICRRRDGALLRELFTRDGAGVLITDRPLEEPRAARLSDVPGILSLLEPLEQGGVLVKRSRERLEIEVNHFQIIERDGTVIACAALYPFPEDGMAEMGCLAVHPSYRRGGRGDRLLKHVESLARAQGIGRLFVLTTQTAHWFRERGFEPASPAALPMAKQALYNYRRNSQVYIKTL
jgi:amino-acid N-acetyltransferase